MRTRQRTIWMGLIGWLAFVALPAAAQQPRVTNAKMQTRSTTAGLAKEFQALVSGQSEPAWVGYAVPVIHGEHSMCCYSSYDDYRTSRCCGRCALEGEHNFSVTSDAHSSTGQAGPVKLEGPEHFFVLYRIEAKRVERIRTYSEECELDAGGLPFLWLTDVRPAESVALLASLVTAWASEEDADGRSGKKHTNQAVAAVALHRDPAADRALESFVAKSQPESLRKHTAFWLGATRGKPGLALLKRMAQEDPSDRVRDQVTFALSVSHEPEAIDEMIRMARSDASTHVRGQALFWLAQKAGKKAAGAITSAIENDPETEVKKKAVFALTQMPKDEGVPLLIQVARTNRNPAVRKQAMFWLGQSHDPRALSFFEEVLAH